MKLVNGETWLTIKVIDGNEVYCLVYSRKPILNILNNTKDEIILSLTEDITENTEAISGIVLEEGVGVNHLMIDSDKIYIMTKSKGNVVIERCG